MEQLIAQFTGIFFMSGIIFILASLIMYLFPPKDINALYGYRSKRSMASQERWDFAQKYSVKQLLKGGLFMVVLGFANYFFDLNMHSRIPSLIILLLVVGYIFYTTELKLKKEFTE